MSIVTKRGDRGRTSLYCGTKVIKDDIRIETCGALDEVSSFLGMAKSFTNDKKIKNIANCIQEDIIILCAEIATTPPAVDRLKKRIDDSSVSFLEKEIYCLENKCNLKIENFCLPGASNVSSALDIARAITRRAERRCVTMSKKNTLKNRNIVIYLNRLSDLLYLLARFSEKKKFQK